MDDLKKSKKELVKEIQSLRLRLEESVSIDSNVQIGDVDSLQTVLIEALPYPTMLIRRDRTVIFANKVAREVGAIIGGQCWQDFGQSEYISDEDASYINQHKEKPPCGTHCTFCLGDEALDTLAPAVAPVIHAFGRIWETYWIPVSDDVYLHYSLDITERKQAEESLRIAHHELERRVEERTEDLAETNQKLKLEVIERKKAEEELREHHKELLHVSRLSTVGEMASGLAHELNQPLCAILTHGNVCLRNSEGGINDMDKFRENLKVITSQAKYAGDIVNSIKDFVQKREPHRATIDVNDVINEVIGFLEQLIRDNDVELDLQLNTKMPLILADRIQIEQVLINLMTNAIESMQGVKTIKHRLVIQVLPCSSNFLKIRVSDTGHGLTEKIDKLLASFFTTKKDGLGIGLSISRSIVEAHGGTLCGQSNRANGSTFEITLPIENVNDITSSRGKES